MGEFEVLELVGAFGLLVILTILAQTLKNKLPTVSDADGNEIGPRGWLPIIMEVVGIGIGVAFGLWRGEDLFAWGIGGFIYGASTTGMYKLGSKILPDEINNDGWLFREE